MNISFKLMQMILSPLIANVQSKCDALYTSHLMDLRFSHLVNVDALSSNINDPRLVIPLS